ncbi:hypothetical protein GPS59_01035 [Acinetobacter haemolyticus]|uniref:hypothetical protein n=1 Tax=Acinetobacter haemolyticus TaxID=29430 RepID=UPI001372A36F|nr:hypothetical protein [Acinetobacter haemolyticus]NAR52613.1 hypothetical protein [Acinetobacter haemolyticus]
MRSYYIKKGNLYLHVQTTAHEDYQDYSDIDTMYTMQYVFKKEKDGAKTFYDSAEASTYIAKRRLKGVEVVRD